MFIQNAISSAFAKIFEEHHSSSSWEDVYHHQLSVIPFFFFLGIFNNSEYMYLRCTIWWFDIDIHCEAITTMKLIKIVTSVVIFFSSFSFFFYHFLKSKSRFRRPRSPLTLLVLKERIVSNFFHGLCIANSSYFLKGKFFKCSGKHSHP